MQLEILNASMTMLREYGKEIQLPAILAIYGFISAARLNFA